MTYTPAEILAMEHPTEEMIIDCLRSVWGRLTDQERREIGRVTLTTLGFTVPILVDDPSFNPWTDCAGRA